MVIEARTNAFKGLDNRMRPRIGNLGKLVGKAKIILGRIMPSCRCGER